MHTAQSILIVDSEADGRSQLRQTLAGLRGVFPHQVVGEADCARSALAQVDSLRPNVLLVDPALPDMNGIELGRRLSADACSPPGYARAAAAVAGPKLIYVSGSDRHALDAFEVRALDYLLKPVDPARLLRALSRASQVAAPGAAVDTGGASPGAGGSASSEASRPGSSHPGPVGSESAHGTTSHSGGTHAGEANAGQPLAGGPAQSGASLAHSGPAGERPLLPSPAQHSMLPAPSGQAIQVGPVATPARQPARRHFAVHERGRLMLVPVEQVIYLKAELKYVTVRTRQREYLIEDSLTALEAEFGDRFVRIHRNALVCRSSIAGFERVPPDSRSVGAEPHWQVVLRDVSERLPVSRRQWSTVRNLMG